MSEADLVSFVQFVAKGQQDVIAQGKQIENVLANIDGVKKVEFKVGGVDKVEGAVNSLKQKFAQLAQGGDLTRMLSGSVEDAMKSAGDSVGTLLASGIGAAVGGALGGILGAQIGNLVSAVPALAARTIDTERDAKAQAEHSVTPEEAEARMGILHAGRLAWSQYTVGKDKRSGADVFEAGLNEMQMQGEAPANAEEAKKRAEKSYERMNQLMALSAGDAIGDPVEMARQIGQLETTHSHRAKVALGRNGFIAAALEEKYKGRTPEDIQAAIAKSDTTQGAITSEELLNVLATKTQDPRVQNFLKAKGEEGRLAHAQEGGSQFWMNSNQTSREEQWYLRNRRMGLAPEEANTALGWTGHYKVLQDEQVKRLEQIQSATKNINALPGMDVSQMPGHELAGATSKEYGFTSLAGLTEKMQQQAGKSEGEDYMKKIYDDGIKIRGEQVDLPPAPPDPSVTNGKN